MFKRGIILMILVLSLTLVFTGCLNIHFGGGKMVVGNGKLETTTVSIEKEITGLNDTGSIDVVIDPNLDGEATIEAESNIIDLVELSQDAQGVLTVSFKDDVSVTLSRGVTVQIPAVKGGTIEVNGSGNISATETLQSDAFNVRVAGSGDISLTLEAQKVSAEINGSGNITLDAKTQQFDAGIFGSGDVKLTGSADTMKLSINGSGSIDARDCEAASADVMIAGSGDIGVNVSSALTGSINGSGDVLYSGNPADVSVSNSGSGDLIKR